MIPAIAEDGERYPVEKMEAHRRGLLHDAISAFIFDRGGRLLIQQRALTKYHCGGLWANTCCTHPHLGETADACAARRLHEELGCAADLRPTAQIEYRADVGGDLIEHERVQVFRGDVDADLFELALNPNEVMAVRWAPLAELRAQADDPAAPLTPWFRIYLRRWAELGLD